MVPNWIFGWAERTPNKVAAVLNDAMITYGEFAARILRARAFFHDQGVTGPGIAVVMPVDPMEFWVVSLALRSLGLTTIASRTVESLADLSLKRVVVVATNQVEAWPSLDELCAKEGWRWISAQAAHHRELAPDARPGMLDGGHILTTSGTTGVHKKVFMDPAFEADLCAFFAGVRGVGASSVEAVFDFGAWTAIGYKNPITAWREGATTLFHIGARPDALLARGDATHATVHPALLKALLAAPADAYARNEQLSMSITSGAITQVEIRAVKARITPNLVSRIGSTESSIFTNTPVETPEDYRWHRPLPNRVVQIVDQDHRPVPVGEIGQLRVNTAGVHAYLEDEEATARFFHDDFFYPGDLAVMREDGCFCLQGRLTDIINIGGVKISPAPIEETLREALGVPGVCLFSNQDETGAEQLHLIVEASSPLPTKRLIAALNACVRGFPGANVHYLPRLPRDPAGKLQRNAAREAALARR